jgi:hypothetical protein
LKNASNWQALRKTKAVSLPPQSKKKPHWMIRLSQYWWNKLESNPARVQSNAASSPCGKSYTSQTVAEKEHGMKAVQYLSVCLMLALLVTMGCSTAGKGPSDLEVVQARTKECVAVGNSKDIAKLMTYIAEDFECPQIGDKASFKEFLDNAKSAGMLDGVEIDISAAKTTITGEEAEIAPVTVRGSFGEGRAVFSVSKVKGVWLISAMDISGL